MPVVPQSPHSVVVAVSPPERLASVPQANPRPVVLAPPKTVTSPLSRALSAVTLDSPVLLVTVGAHAEVVKLGGPAVEAVVVPAEF